MHSVSEETSSPVELIDLVLSKKLSIENKKIKIKQGLESPLIYVAKGVRIFSFLTRIDCSMCRLEFLPLEEFTFLKTLDCSHNNLNSVTVISPSLKTLNCSQNQNLTSLVLSHPHKLVHLDAYGTRLALFPTGLTSLTQLDCSWYLGRDPLVIPEDLHSLTTLRCYESDIEHLPQNLSSLTSLDCLKNRITTLPNTLTSLTYLNCCCNAIERFPDNLFSLQNLMCSFNRIKTFSELLTASNLSALSCDNNQELTQFPDNFSSLTELHCTECSLVSLPSRMDKIIHLACSKNRLISLPEHMSSVVAVKCSDNQIRALPTSLPLLGELWCENNKLLSIPRYPSLWRLLCDGNEFPPTLLWEWQIIWKGMLTREERDAFYEGCDNLVTEHNLVDGHFSHPIGQIQYTIVVSPFVHDLFLKIE